MLIIVKPVRQLILVIFVKMDMQLHNGVHVAPLTVIVIIRKTVFLVLQE